MRWFPLILWIASDSNGVELLRAVLGLGIFILVTLGGEQYFLWLCDRGGSCHMYFETVIFPLILMRGVNGMVEGLHLIFRCGSVLVRVSVAVLGQEIKMNFSTLQGRTLKFALFC